MDAGCLCPEQFGNKAYALLDGEAFKLVEDIDPDAPYYSDAEKWIYDELRKRFPAKERMALAGDVAREALTVRPKKIGKPVAGGGAALPEGGAAQNGL